MFCAPCPPRLCPSTLPTPCLRQGMRIQLPQLPQRPRILGQPTDAVSSIAKNIGQAGNNVATSVGQGGVAISRVAYMLSCGMTVIGIQMGQESLRPRAVILGMALVFLALELVLLPIVLPLLHNQGRGVSSASKIDMARRDYDSLRSFYDTTATGNQLVKHVCSRGPTARTCPTVPSTRSAPPSSAAESREPLIRGASW